MAVTHISYFEIVDAHGWAAYNYQVDVGVTSAGHTADIQTAVGSGRLPRGGRRPHRNPERPERFLDIRETRGDGIYAYVFYLNAELRGVQRLEFATGPAPFQILPMNSGGNERFLTEVTRHGPRWASFVCSLEDVRNSPLATRIRGLPTPPEPLAITIPITFSLIDPLLTASPWVIPAEGDEEGHDHPVQHLPVSDGAKKSSAAAARGRFTHGGIHPAAVTYLSIPLGD
jgi:hypothetical protein